jgi:hypothetical protein
MSRKETLLTEVLDELDPFHSRPTGLRLAGPPDGRGRGAAGQRRDGWASVPSGASGAWEEFEKRELPRRSPDIAESSAHIHDRDEGCNWREVLAAQQ